MVPLLLLLILVVIAWPIIAIFADTLLLALGSHLNIIIPTALIAIAYIAFLAPIAKRNNIKLGGGIGEPLDPSKPIGPEFRQMAQVHSEVPPVKVSFLDANQWKQVAPASEIEARHVADQAGPRSARRTVVLVALALVVAGPLAVFVINQGMQLAKSSSVRQGSLSISAAASKSAPSVGKWRVQPGQSATLEAGSGGNYLGQTVTLIIRCNVFPVLRLDFHDYLGSDRGVEGYKTVIVKVGHGAVQEFKMALGPDQTTLDWIGSPPDFISSFLREGVLHVYTAPYNSEPVQAVFDLTGARAAVGPIIDTCQPTKR